MKKYQLKAQEKYRKSHTKTFSIKFYNESDRDILKKLESVENKTDYIRQLIHADIQK